VAVENKISPSVPLLRDDEIGLKRWSIRLDWKDFERFGIWGKVRTRGTHVNVPKIGSRVGVLCFGGILGICAELRRELVWGNFNLDFFGVLVGVPRGVIEEGGHCVTFLCVGEFIVCQLGDFRLP
jgi:hypothetical protein